NHGTGPDDVQGILFSVRAEAVGCCAGGSVAGNGAAARGCRIVWQAAEEGGGADTGAEVAAGGQVLLHEARLRDVLRVLLQSCREIGRGVQVWHAVQRVGPRGQGD